jgi:predicted phage tail protein
MFTAVTLHGELGGVAGKAEWRLSVKSVGEAVHAIETNLRRKGKSIYDYLASKDNGQAEYRIIIDGRDFESVDELQAKLKHYKTIDIIPVPAGSGNTGLWEVIIGVVLVVVGIVTIATFGATTPLFAGALGAGLTYGAVGSAIILQGIALAIGGLAQLLNPPPATANQTNKPSYLFGSIVNSIEQGGPVPLGYGALIIGSQVINSAVSTVNAGTVVHGAGELQTNQTGTNPATTDANVIALGGNSIPVDPINDPVNVQNPDGSGFGGLGGAFP